MDKLQNITHKAYLLFITNAVSYKDLWVLSIYYFLSNFLKGYKMKKHALIIGCSGFNLNFLPGVKKDVDSFKFFLISNTGGAWYDNEITSLYNCSLIKINNTIAKLKTELNDFVFLVFSGHGEYSIKHNCRKLYVTDKEYIYESDLLDLSNKQITIIDTCAGEEDIMTESIKKISSLESHTDNKYIYRELHETYIKRCSPQEIILYACDINESSIDETNGGLYSSNLIKAAELSKEDLNPLQAHNIASEIVIAKSKRKQNPQYISSVRFGPKLPFSLYSI